MDQLKIILEHRFWVLSALAILLPPIGWYMSTGDMAAETEKRSQKISSAIKSIDNAAKDVPKTANKEWIKGAQQVNDKLAARVDETQQHLVDHQRPIMTFHPLVKKEYEAAKVKYRDDKPQDPQAFLRMKRLFMSRYNDMWDSEVYQAVEPFEFAKNDGKVLFRDQNGNIPIVHAPSETWQQRQMISTQEMWDAQEDLWMLHALMKAVARVNEGSVNIDDARIKRLLQATLRGGNSADLADRRKKKQSTGTPAGGQEQGGGGAPGGGHGLGLGGGFLRRGGGEDAGPKAIPMIEPDDIFGSDSDAGGAVSGSSKKGGAGEPAAVFPYVAQEGGKWRGRGFVLRVVMDHQEIPKLLTVLSEAPFPVVIMQVEHREYDYQKDRQQNVVVAGENDPAQKNWKTAEERVNMAMNQSNLAEVLVAGYFIFYDEPASAGAPAAAAPTTTAPAPAKGAAPVKLPSGAPASPTAPGAGKPVGTPTPAPAPVGTSAKGAPTTKAAGSAPAVPQNPKPAGATTPQAPPSSGSKLTQPGKS